MNLSIAGNGLSGTGQPGTAVAVPGAAAPEPRLIRAAHEFESQMMTELLKPLTQGGEDEESGANGALGSFAAEALGRGLSEQGGLGIARSVLASLSHTGNQPRTGEVTRTGNGNTGMKISQ